MPTSIVNGANLYYETAGQGEPLVFIHGLGSSTRDWEYQVAAFASDYRVIAVDLRGHGQSDKPEGPYSIHLFVSDLVGMLGELGVTAAHLVGISLGGAVAFQLAIDRPAMVRTLTVVNGSPHLPATLEEAKQGVDRRVRLVRQYGMRALGQALVSNLLPAPEHAIRREEFVDRWAENDPDAFIEATRSTLFWDVTDQLGSIQCPVLIIAAEQDYTPVSFKESYLGLLPHAELAVIAGAHHAVPIECPEEFNAVLARFLAR